MTISPEVRETQLHKFFSGRCVSVEELSAKDD